MANKNNNQFGFALIEVMLAALILSVGAIAFMKLQRVGLQYSFNDYSRTQGISIASDFVDQVRTNTNFVKLSDNKKNNFILGGAIKNTTPPQANANCASTKPGKQCVESTLAYHRFIISKKMASVMAPERSLLCYNEHKTIKGYLRVTYMWRDRVNTNVDNFSNKNCPQDFSAAITNSSDQENSVTIYAQI